MGPTGMLVHPRTAEAGIGPQFNLSTIEGVFSSGAKALRSPVSAGVGAGVGFGVDGLHKVAKTVGLA